MSNVAKFTPKVVPVKAGKVSLETNLSNILGDYFPTKQAEEKLKDEMEKFAEKTLGEYDDDEDVSVSIVTETGVVTVYASLDGGNTAWYQAILRVYTPTRIFAATLETSPEKAIAALAKVAPASDSEED